MASSMTSLAVGLMSGTSMDGIDACLVEIREEEGEEEESIPSVRLLHFLSCPYPAALRQSLLALAESGSVKDVCTYNALLGRLFAEAAKAVVANGNMKMEQMAVIGSHGQTIHHLPSPQSLHSFSISSTLQIGDPSVIANECGVTTVGDFRVADMAIGGEGAPLVPYLDRVLLERNYRSTGRLSFLLNVGGIANISVYIPGDCSHLIGFDTGPGNILMDSLMQKLYGKDYDENGETAAKGRVSDKLLDQLVVKDGAFLSRPPPKSTGREHYSKQYMDWVMEKTTSLRLTPEDTIATITVAVWESYVRFIKPAVDSCSYRLEGHDLFVSGGGAKNPVLMSCLQRRFGGFHVATTVDIGIDPDAKEAVCFALLAYQACKGRPTNIPSVTGAKRTAILGKICPVLREKT